MKTLRNPQHAADWESGNTKMPDAPTKENKRVPITQFHAPNGRRSDSWCEVSAEAFAKFEKARENSLRVTAEILRTGQVSICLEHPEIGDFDCRLCSNGPGPNPPPKVLEEMLLEFTVERFSEWLASSREN